VDRMSRTDRLRHMHERRLSWQPIPRCSCGRVLSALSKEGVGPCERCLTLCGDLQVDTKAVVTAAFQNAVRDRTQLVERALAAPSIWDARLQPAELAAHVVSSSALGQRGWWALRVTPSFGADVERFALVDSALGESVRVVLAGVAPVARVCDVRTGRTLIVEAA
jgi:hypothetical protein